MSDAVIRAEGLGKQYRIGAAAERHDTIGAVLRHAFTSPFRNLRALREIERPRADDPNSVWALQDVSFEVRSGEVLGIVGKNGAGKSTLLKVLSRITEPTRGRAVVHGRVGSLLEVGTGFHGELTGRENVFLNGSLLGMDREYITRRFDEIVEFSGVERYIDTPVKRYSSGMYLRLAFAVAAHLEPEVLIVDEVLAVGDQDFQRKCVGKMGEVAGQGRTVLFVSHNMGAVLKLCQRAILLRAGRKVLDGSAREVVHAYLTAGLEDAAERRWSGDDAPGDETARLRRVSIRQNGQEATAHVDIRHPFDIQIEFDALRDFPEFNIQLFLHDDEGMTVLHTMQHLSPQEDISRVRAGRHVSVCHVPGGTLNAGHYWLALKADVPYVRWIWDADRVLRFAVENTDAGMARYPDGYFRGVIGPIHVSWERQGPSPAGGAPLP